MDLAIVAGIGLIGSFIANNNENNDPITELEKKYSRNNNQYKKYIEQIESNENNKNITYENGYQDINTVKLFPTEYNSKVRHIYDTKSVPQLNKKYYEMAGIQAEKSKNPVLTNILSPFFQPYENVTKQELTMGSVPVNELNTDNNQSFNDQFKLQTVDNTKEPFSIGDKLGNSLNDFSPFFLKLKKRFEKGESIFFL
jgi:hypothetical protein